MTSSPSLADDRATVGVEGLDRAAEVAAADLALPHRHQRRGADERGADIGAAGDRLQMDRWADRLVDVAEALHRQRRARRADAPDRREVGQLAGPHALLAAGHEVRRRCPEVGDALLGRQPPQRAEVRVGRGTVVQHDARVDGQPRDEVVPHHPAGGAEPEEPIRRAEVVVQRVDLQVLEQDAAVAVDDRLRQPGRARGVEDEERMVERHALEGQRAVAGRPARPRSSRRGCVTHRSRR